MHTFYCRSFSRGMVLAIMLAFVITCLSNSQSGNAAEDAPSIKEYLEVLNSGDREIIQDYIKDHYASSFLKRLPEEMHILRHMAFYYESAGLGYEYHGKSAEDDNGLSAIVVNRFTGARLELRIPLTDDSPNKINGFPDIKSVAQKSEKQRGQKFNDDEIIKRLEQCMEKLTGDDEFSGTVLFAKNGKPLFKKAFGMASKSYGVPNREDTRFNIASVGKMFTGVAINRLAQEGKLSFEDPVSKYLPPDWIKSEVGDKIQIRHLLTHTAGFGTYFRKLYMQIQQPFFRSVDDYKILIADETPAFEPGTKWSYSNSGMHLLGVVIEKVTGGSYYDYIYDNIYKPAGMTNTDYSDKDIPQPNRATGYTKEGGIWRENLFTRVLKGGPSGGGFSTVEDLLKFDTALRSHRILNQEFTELALSAKPEVGSAFYGYGFFTGDGPAGRVAEHSGNGSGISCSFKMYLDTGYTVVVLSNYSRPAADIVAQVIHQLIVSR